MCREELLAAVAAGDVDCLKAVQAHGGEVTKFCNDADSNNGLLHYAVRGNQTAVVDYLLLL